MADGDATGRTFLDALIAKILKHWITLINLTYFWGLAIVSDFVVLVFQLVIKEVTDLPISLIVEMSVIEFLITFLPCNHISLAEFNFFLLAFELSDFDLFSSMHTHPAIAAAGEADWFFALLTVYLRALLSCAPSTLLSIVATLLLLNFVTYYSIDCDHFLI